jgi:hypothetical protein
MPSEALVMMIPSMRDRLMAGRGIGWRVARTGIIASLFLFTAALILLSAY